MAMDAGATSVGMQSVSTQADPDCDAQLKKLKNRRKRRCRKTDQDALAATVEHERVFRGRIRSIMDPRFGFVLNQRDTSVQCGIDNIYAFGEQCDAFQTVSEQRRLPQTQPMEMMHPFGNAPRPPEQPRMPAPLVVAAPLHPPAHPVFTIPVARDPATGNPVFIATTVVQPPRLAKTTIEWARQPFVVPNYSDRSETTTGGGAGRTFATVATSTDDADGTDGGVSTSCSDATLPAGAAGAAAGYDCKSERHAARFQRYITQAEALAGLQTGIFGKGVVRINPKNYKQAYVTPSDRMQLDYIISDVTRRNRALEGDVVVYELLDEVFDERRCIRVVYMAERVHPRTAVGSLALVQTQSGQARIATFTPRDRRFPRMYILEKSLPVDFFDAPSAYARILVEAELIEWQTPARPVGVTLEIVGNEANLNVEMHAILTEHHVDWKPYSIAALKQMPRFVELVDGEIANRLDLRAECVFTVDPPNAKDLDDAVSIRRLPNGNFVVGVHIADVSFFLREDSYIDAIAAARATSTYLPNNVIHMLPAEMCHACSLLPGRDSLAFTVQWEMTPCAAVVATSFARTVINSCTQLSYEHAQTLIDRPDAPPKSYALPPLLRFKREQLRDAVGELHALARGLRRRRDDAGALRIEKIDVGVHFRLDGTPQEFSVVERGAAGEMIEEFMLLANVTVAEKIYAAFPRMAMLRLHQEPHPLLLGKLKDQLENVGVHLHTANSFTLARSLERYNGSDYMSRARFIALNYLMRKPMVRAEYVCVGNRSPREFRHYALNATFYTHFTSPIRRYMDIVVHRILAGALCMAPLPQQTFAQLERIARNCNLRKHFSKLAAEAYTEISLARCIERQQPYITEAVVVKVLDRSFDAIVLNTGTVVRIYLPDVELLAPALKTYGSREQYTALQLTFPSQYNYPDCRVVIDLFQIVRVALRRKRETNRLEATFITVVTELPKNVAPGSVRLVKID